MNQTQGVWERIRVKEGESISEAGGEMPVYVARPIAEGRYPAVIVLQEIFGVNHHIRRVTDRIAAEGYLAVAPDLFYRQGEHFESGYEDYRPGLARAAKLKEEEFLDDMDAILRSIETGKIKGAVSTPLPSVVGFCRGGTLAYLAACSRKLRACVSFYGSKIASGPVSKTTNLSCPILLFFGEEDQSIPLTDIEKIEAALSHTQVPHEIRVYPAAKHGFFCDERVDFHPEAAADAWGRVKEFLARETTVH